jgi:spermidine/putrescine transport system ATP-binding protein
MSLYVLDNSFSNQQESPYALRKNLSGVTRLQGVSRYCIVSHNWLERCETKINAMVELIGVSRSFAGTTALQTIDLTVAEGEFLTLLGPSGCGKTTTLRLVAGFLEPTSGEIRINGTPVERIPAYKRPVNTVFQHYALFPHMNVAENVGFGLRMQRLSKEVIATRVERALALVRLEGLAGRKPRELSGGQQQRVALARALVLEPKVLLLDEPLGALDLQLRRAVQVELKQLQRELGMTFIYVTHDQEEALAMSDRIAVMRAGQIEQLGTPEEVYNRPETSFVATFLGEANILRGAGHGDRLVWAGHRLRLAEPVPEGEVLVALRPEHLHLAEPGTEQNRIEGVVLERLFLGTGTRLLLQVGAERLTAIVPPGAQAAIGERVQLTFTPAQAVVVRP